MTPENFCYWLRGFDEITNGQVPTQEQWEVIRKHLLLVFTQVIDSNHILNPTQIEPMFVPQFHHQSPINPDMLKPIC